MSYRSDDNMILWVVLGMIAVVVTGALIFWGTVGAVAYHFIHKLW